MEPVADLVELVSDSDAVNVVKARGRKAETGRETQTHATWDFPSNERRNVVRSLTQRESARIAEPAVCFNSDSEAVRAKSARAGRPTAPEWTGRTQRIAEFPWLVSKILFGDEVF